jgi:hypothetical protein
MEEYPMTNSNDSASRRARKFPQALFEDWLLQLVLVAGTVAAMIQGVMSLGGAGLG